MKTLTCLRFSVFIFFIIACFSIQAKTDEVNSRLVQYLAQEKVSLTVEINEAKQFKTPVSEEQILTRLQNNIQKKNLINAKIQSFHAFLANQKKLKNDLDQKIRQLQQSPVENISTTTLQEKLGQFETLITVNQKTMEFISEDISLSQQYLNLLDAESRDLTLAQAKVKLKKELIDLRQKEKIENRRLTELYQQNLQSQQDKAETKDTNKQFVLDARILLNNERIALLQQGLVLINLHKKVEKADVLLLEDQTIKTTQTVSDIYKDSINQTSSMLKSLQEIDETLDSQSTMFQVARLEKSFKSLKTDIVLRTKELSSLKQLLQEKLDGYQAELKKQLSARQTLSDYYSDLWTLTVENIMSIPKLFYNYGKSLITKVKDNYMWLDTVPLIMFWGSLVLCLTLFLGVYRLLVRLTRDKERSRFAGYLYQGALTLLKRNLIHLTGFSLILCILNFTYVPFANYAMLFNLFLVWLAFRSMILIARLILMESISDESGHDVSLYHRIRWLLIAGGWATALMVFSQQLPMAVIAQDLFNRLFMLFILAISIVIWKSRISLILLIRPLLNSNKSYLKNAISLMVFLIPVTLFTTGVIGLIGYVNFAWNMSEYQAYLLLLILGYVLARGLLFDGLELFSEWLLASTRNGWLWIEVVLKPLDKILRVGILLVSFLLLLEIFGWYSDTNKMQGLMQFLNYPIVNFSGIYITTLSVLEFSALFSVFIWITKWTREFCYRWLFIKIKDLGIRNSMAVFSQYGVVIVGGLITLKVLGVDITGMTVVLGGLAVGMGFGLRDFASNIIGGLMLLIERPVRVGDLISLGTYEGKVEHIGIRSMRICSWDNTEIVIPNAETLNKPFTNWTHQNSVVRSVVPIKVSREDDPLIIQELILDVLAIIPEILPDPPVQVLLKKIDDALIEFEIRYFINIQLHSLFEVRSKVLFAISAQFKAAGIKPPIPPISIELRESERELFIGKKSAK